MKWEKQGVVFNIDNDSDLQCTHAGIPVVDILNDKVWRIYYTARDKHGISRPFYIDVEAKNPKHVLRRHDQPILEIGKLGACDDCGVTPTSIVKFKDKKYMFYCGWTVRNTISYHNSNFVAISADDGETWQKVEGPVISPTPWEPYCSGASFVLADEGILKMYYTSFVGWETHDGHPEPLYHIKYAESDDGLTWRRGPHVAVDFLDNKKGGIARASVIKEDGLYRMWYTYRGASDYRTNRLNSYRIGYAESKDGKTFVRMDGQVGIDISESGWDDTMITYPHVIKVDGVYYLFYNGNAFGKTGFGYATMSEEVLKC